MYTVEISTAAELEIDNIAAWYDKRVKGLSFRFYHDLDISIKAIIKYPSTFGFYNSKKGIRKCNLNDFPYKIFYEVKGSCIHLIAVIHSGRSTTFTKRRLR